MHLLVVEDDPVIGRSLDRGFNETGHRCEWVQDGDSALHAIRSNIYDAVVLDVMLPKRSGLEVLRAVRQQHERLPVILLTALGTIEERVAGLKAGADDYLVKPFAFSELMARLEAIYRRATDRPSSTHEAGGFTLDLAMRRVRYQNREIDLTPTEFSLLEFLMRHAGQIVTRKMLCEHIWDTNWEGETNVIEVHVNRLRGKLEKAGANAPIQTVRGRGYVLREA